MYYALIYYTHLNSEALNQFRRKYDPWVELIEDHIGFIFPVSDTIELDDLVNHINTIIRDKKAFDIHISGLVKSWDHFLLLTVKEGNNNIIELYDEFYTGLLAPYRRDEIDFIPHIGLGLFVEKEDYEVLEPKVLPLDEEKFNMAYEEAQKLNFDFWRRVEKLSLIKLKADLSEYWDIKEFRLH
jgi:hypothetical protein